MKNIKYKSVSILGFLVLVLFAASCEKADDRHRQFFEGGETIYIAKADSLVLSGGRHKIQLSWLLLSDPKIHKYKVYWNNRQDSVEKIVQKTASVDTVRLLLENMSEGTYQFEIFTYDKLGNSSVKTTGIGKVYGEIYESTLLPRTYRSVRRLGNDVEFNWTQADEGFYQVEIQYVDTYGNTVSKRINKEAELDTLYNFPNGGSFEYRSSFRPDSNALDIFYTEPKTFTVSTSVIDWNDYGFIFGHFDYLVAKNEEGELFRFPNNGVVGFQSPVRLGAGFNIYDMMFSYSPNAGIIFRVRNTGTGSPIQRAPLNAAGVLGATVGLGSGWQGFDQVFGYENMLVTRSGSLIRRYPLSTTWTFTPANSAIAGVEFQTEYIKMFAARNGIFGITADGKLWNIPLAKEYTAVAAPRRLISDGWNQYDLISTFSGDILARKPNGELWIFPVDKDGNVAAGNQVSNIVEKWN